MKLDYRAFYYGAGFLVIAIITLNSKNSFGDLLRGLYFLTAATFVTIGAAIKGAK